MLSSLTKLQHGLLNLMFPPDCLSCQNIPDENNQLQLCSNCFAQLELLTQPLCLKCSAPIGEHMSAAPRCQYCEQITTYFKRAFAVTSYHEPVLSMLHNYKFNKNPEVAKVFAYLLDICVTEQIPQEIRQTFDFCVCVPSHPASIASNGYCHSHKLATQFSKLYPLPFKAKILQMHKKNYTPQHTLESRAARIRNVADSFFVPDKHDIKNKTILLLDDILTTGATAAECSKTLLKAGAKAVFVVVIARAYGHMGKSS